MPQGHEGVDVMVYPFSVPSSRVSAYSQDHNLAYALVRVGKGRGLENIWVFAPKKRKGIIVWAPLPSYTVYKTSLPLFPRRARHHWPLTILRRPSRYRTSSRNIFNPKPSRTLPIARNKTKTMSAALRPLLRQLPRAALRTLAPRRCLNTADAPVLYSAHAKVVGARTG